ncbi:fluoride efflux transporter FluC [Arthrobacter sp. CAL618]|uniref:fluoride efflux transporter FluC n=1 Tax=Arthrobacter sp. CAL618 TaxID=1055770 RepID=UPI000408B62C|nr:CrcB family protein [Arthrobacter sp. CAL618]
MTDNYAGTPPDSNSFPGKQSLPRDVLLVFLGGTVGAALRLLASVTIPNVDGIPLQILGINIIGAFALGTLLETLARQGPDVGYRRTTRLLLGTGLIGGFTTFSTLAVGSVELLQEGRLATGVLYALGTIIVGAGSSAGGILLAAGIHTRKRRNR